MFSPAAWNYKLHSAAGEGSYHLLGIAKHLTRQKEHMRNHQEIWMGQPGHSARGLYKSPEGMGTMPQDQAFDVSWFCSRILWASSWEASKQIFSCSSFFQRSSKSNTLGFRQFLMKVPFMALCVCFRKYFMLLRCTMLLLYYCFCYNIIQLFN